LKRPVSSLAESRLEGKAEGKAEVVLKQLTLRFGPVSDLIVRQVRAASVDMLDEYSTRLLTAKTLAEVLE
jgi:hypothetical protein